MSVEAEVVVPRVVHRDGLIAAVPQEERGESVVAVAQIDVEHFPGAIGFREPRFESRVEGKHHFMRGKGQIHGSSEVSAANRSCLEVE